MAAFPLDIRTALYLDGRWTDISSDVYVRDQKVITRGRRDQGTQTDPSTLSLTLNNRRGKYSPRNALSPLFGKIGRNTPIRVSVPTQNGSYVFLKAGSDRITTPPNANLAITGDLDVRLEAEINWYPPETQTLMGQGTSAGNQRGWLVQINAAGELLFYYSWDGLVYRFSSCQMPDLPMRAALRITLDVDNGSGGNTVSFYHSTSADGPWTLIQRNEQTTTGTVFNPSTPKLGISPPGFAGPYGRIYRFEMLQGIDGAPIVSADFRTATADATTFTDSTGRVWTIESSGEIRGHVDRFIGEVSSWPVEWSLDDADVWTSVQASSLLRRMGQGQKPLQSTLRRRIPAANPSAYWPFEEAEFATRAYSPIPEVNSATTRGLEFAALNSLPSSAPLPRLTASSGLSAPVPSTMPSGNWQVEFTYNADSKIPASDSEIISIDSPNGTVRRWRVMVATGVAKVWGYNDENVRIVEQNIGIGTDIFQGWVRLRFYLQTSGGSTTWRIDWQDIGGDAGGFDGTYTGTPGRVSRVYANWTSAMEGWGFGHLYVIPVANADVMAGSEQAYLGETARQRIFRLAVEEGVRMSFVPGTLETTRVGYQRMDSILSLFEAAADADGGMLLENYLRMGLLFRSRSSLYSQEPKLVLSYTAPGLGPELRPVNDDSAVRNDITVNRDGGSSGRVVQESGPLSTQAPPLGVGLYDESVTLSLADDAQAEPAAAWRLHLGTFDGARYPVVSVTLHKPGAETHIPAVVDLHEGDVIRLTNLPPWVSNDDVDLMVQGWTETIDLYQWTISFNCSPAGPWNVGTVGGGSDPATSRIDTDGTILATAASSADTELSVRVTSGSPWTTDPAEMPYAVRLGGEVVTVVAASSSPVSDAFNRTVTVGWGSTDTGQVWATSGGSSSDFSVKGA